MTKFLVIFCLIFGICFGDDEKAKSECLKENNMTEKDIKMYKSLEEIPDEVLCYSKCLNMKNGLIGKNGKINMEMISSVAGVDKLNKEEVDQLEECIEEVGAIEECADMKKLQNCFIEVMT